MRNTWAIKANLYMYKTKLPINNKCVNAVCQYVRAASVEAHLKYFKKWQCLLASVRWSLALKDEAEARQRELKRQFARYSRVSWLNKLTKQK